MLTVLQYRHICNGHGKRHDLKEVWELDVAQFFVGGASANVTNSKQETHIQASIYLGYYIVKYTSSMERLSTGFGLNIGFIDQLHTWLASTSTYSATANLHSSQNTTARVKLFTACYVFTSRSLATASNSGYSSASCAQVLSSQTSVRTWEALALSLAYKISAWTTKKTQLL
jgi:hypothetical protein